MSKYLIIPGYNGSDESHWQSLWEQNLLLNSERLELEDYKSIKRSDWVRPILRKLVNTCDEYIIIAHSLGCLAFVHTYGKYILKNVNAAFLVAPPDVESNENALFLGDFAPIPSFDFEIPTYVVASSNDTYCSIERAEEMANKWNSTFINIGDKGHINSISELGSWQEGVRLLAKLESENSILVH